MKIIKQYKEDFKKEFEKDNGEILVSLINEDKSKQAISEKINQIKTIKNSFPEIENNQENKIRDLELKTKTIQAEIEFLNNKEPKEQKRNEKLEINKKEIKDIIRQELEKINIELE